MQTGANSAKIITVTGPPNITEALPSQPYDNKRFKGVVCRPLQTQQLQRVLRMKRGSQFEIKAGSARSSISSLLHRNKDIMLEKRNKAQKTGAVSVNSLPRNVFTHSKLPFDKKLAK